MNEILMQLINQEVNNDITANRELIVQELTSGISDDTDLTPEMGIMCTNAIRLSEILVLTKIATVLEELGLLHLTEDELRRLLLTRQ